MDTNDKFNKIKKEILNKNDQNWKIEENWINEKLKKRNKKNEKLKKIEKNEDKWSKLNKRKIEENWKTEEIEKCDWIQNYKYIKIEKLYDTGRNLTKLKNQKSKKFKKNDRIKNGLKKSMKQNNSFFLIWQTLICGILRGFRPVRYLFFECPSRFFEA